MNHKDHWDNVRALKCCVSLTDQAVTIHHCHGGSMIDAFGKAQSPGEGQRQNHFLVIPLAEKYHTGDFGIDTGMGVFKGVRDWESVMGAQVYWLKWVNKRLDYDIFDLAGVPDPFISQADMDVYDGLLEMW
jgi:hypothetical protein